MKRLILFTLLFSFFTFCIKAQQVEQFDLLQENASILNPAITGTDGQLHGFATFRKQFVNIAQSPYTAVVAFDGLIPDKHIGLGGYLIEDVTGPTGKTGATFDFSYHLPLQKKYSHYSSGNVDHMLCFGASVSLVQYHLDGSQLQPNQTNDPLLFTNNSFKIFPDASFGVYYKWKDYLYAGLSVPQIMGLDVNYVGNDGTAQIRMVQHINFLGGGKIAWDRDKYSIDPVVAFMWVDGAPPQGVVGARLNMLNVFWIGMNYKSADYLVFQAGFNVKQIFFFGYSCELNVASYRPDVGTTHEITLTVKTPKASRVWRGAGPALRF